MTLAAALLLSAGAYAQENAIAGVVRDSSNHETLPGVTLQLASTKHYAITDAFGRFRFDKVAPGTRTVLIRSMGYRQKAQAVKAGEQLVEVYLTPYYTFTEEVVVLATRADDKTPTTFTNIGKDAIEKQNFGQDLPFLLNWTPSVVTTSDAGAGVGYTGLRIRGSDATRVNVTINGIPYNDSESQGTFWVNIPDIASSAQSIQVQRGVGTSTNGVGAFGASINLQTNTRRDEPYAEVTSAAGSFNTFRNTVSFGTGLLNGRWVVDGRLSKIVSDGFIDRATSDLQSYYFSAGYYQGNTMIKAITFGGKERTYQSWYGVPESRLHNDTEAMLVTAMNEGWNEAQTQLLLNSGSRTFNIYTYPDQVDDYRQDHYQLHLSQKIDAAITANVALHYTPGKGYYEEYRYSDDFENYGLSPVTIGDSVITATDLVRRRWLDSDFYGLTYSLNYELQQLNLIVGGGWNRYDCDHFGEITWAQVSPVAPAYRYYFNNGDKRDFNVYAKATYQFTDKLGVYGDLQYRRIDYETVGIENRQNLLDIRDTFHFFNPKAGIIFTPTDNQQFYASYSVANREPVRDDFVDAPGGKAPLHETLHNLEAGYKITGSRWMLHGNYYLMDYRDQLVLTGQINDVGASVRTNVADSYRMGVELDGAWRISRHFSWNANITLSENKIREFTEVYYDYGPDFEDYNAVNTTHRNTDISFSPNAIAASGITYQPNASIDITLMSKYVGRQFLDNTSNRDRSIDAYVVNDLRLRYTLRPSFAREVTLSLLLNNFLDEAYESNGYTWGYAGGGALYRENYYFPQAGRNLMAMVALKF